MTRRDEILRLLDRANAGEFKGQRERLTQEIIDIFERQPNAGTERKPS